MSDWFKARGGCGCSCHIVPGVKHVVPCCQTPPLTQEQFDARFAGALLEKRNMESPVIVREPKHCDDCFEGCPKCEGRSPLPATAHAETHHPAGVPALVV